MARFRAPDSVPSLPWSVILFLALACVSLAGLDFRQILLARDTQMREMGTQTANLSQSLAQHVEDVFEVADISLIGVQARFEAEGTSPAVVAAWTRLMRVRIANQPLFRTVLLVGADGLVLSSSDEGLPPGSNHGGQPWFQFHRDHADRGPRVGSPARDDAEAEWLIPVSRRVDAADGSFAGVAVIMVPMESFRHSFESFDLGQRGAILLLNDRGTLLARRPFDAASIGRDMSNSQVLRLSKNGTVRGAYEYKAVIDGADRLGSGARTPKFGLVVMVALEKGEILADWWRDAKFHLVLLSMSVMAVAVMGWRIVVQMRRRMRAEALYRMLAENSTDAVTCLGLDGTRQYISPSFQTMSGWPVDALIGKSWLEIVPPEDHPVVTGAFADMVAGRGQMAVTYRYMRPDKSTFWVEMRGRLIDAGLGGAKEMVGNIRDITRQKAAEEQLARANADLAKLSLVDALTGVANRRHFDQTLRKEWSRSIRSAEPVSLLMIDVDHFKAYNDQYGHPGGDVCLRTIAAVLDLGVHRRSDLVARYGGEEFAVILPGTPGGAAWLLAEAMRRALEDQGIAHLGHPGGIVTVSIGVAAASAERGSRPDLLIEAADRALYEAKRTGRNRVVLVGEEARGHEVMAG